MQFPTEKAAFDKILGNKVLIIIKFPSFVT